MDVLEKNSENMEKMTKLMNKMFIKLESRDVPYKLQIYQKRRRGQNRQNIRQSKNWKRNRSYSREKNYNNNRGYGCCNFRGRHRGNFRRGGFQGRDSGSFRRRDFSRDRN